MPFTSREFNPNYPKCPKHSIKRCELHCEQCNIPVCLHCVSSFVDLVKALQIKKDALQIDLQELEKTIHPKYKDIASCIPVQKMKEIDNSPGQTWRRVAHGNRHCHQENEN